MTAPVCSSSTAPRESIDSLIHDATGARDDVRLDSTPPVVHGRNVQHEELESVILGAAEVAAEHYGVALGPFTTGYEMLSGMASDFRRGREENTLYHYDMMRGALAAFELRAGDREVVSTQATNPAYRDGFDRAQALMTRDGDFAMQIRSAVLATETEGYAAVVSGRDHGPKFERRYRDDLCFKHAVDHARGHRESDDARWGEIRGRVGAQCAVVQNAVCDTPRRM